MIQRFASASLIAAVVIAIVAGIFRLIPDLNMEGRYHLVTLYCMVPLAWGVWAVLIPKSWLPNQLPKWGAILGLILGAFGFFVLDLPSQVLGKAVSVGQKVFLLCLAIGIYFVLWGLIRQAYQALCAPPTKA